MDTRLKGDFEITSSYEILQVGEPIQRHGVAFALLVQTDTPRRDVAELTRSRDAPHGDVYNCARISTDDQGQRTYHHERPSAGADRGRLQLTRRGREVTLSAAEGPAGEFKELTRYDLGTEDVIQVSATAFTGYAPNALDLRILDLRVRGLSAPESAAPGSSLAGPQSPRSRTWLFTAGLLGLLLFLTALVLWLVALRRRRGEDRSRRAPEPLRLPPGGPSEVPAPGLRSTAVQSSTSGPWLLVVLPAALGVGLLTWWVVGGNNGPSLPQDGEQSRVPAVFRQDFRSADLDRNMLQPLSPGEVERDGNGLRIRLEADPERRSSRGFDTAFGVHGDFEITVSYEILDAEQPTEGYGNGVGLFAPTTLDSQEAISLARRLMPDGKVRLVSNHMTPAGGKVNHRVKSIPSTSPSGRLRLTRVGPILHYLIADGPDALFMEMEQIDMGTADLRFIRVEGDRGRSEVRLDARFLDFSVQADDLPGLPTAGPSPVRLLTRGSWLMPAGAALLIGLALLNGWLLARRRRHTAPVPVTAGRSKPLVPPVCYPCPGCGHALRVKAELAGKKVRCPRCNTVQLVPATAPVGRPGSAPTSIQSGGV
jgi:hypothetical protein